MRTISESLEELAELYKKLITLGERDRAKNVRLQMLKIIRKYGVSV